MTTGDDGTHTRCESGDLYSRPAKADAMNECGAEGVTGADGVCHSNFRGRCSNVFVTEQQRAAICAAGHAHSLKVEDAGNAAAELFQILADVRTAGAPRDGQQAGNFAHFIFVQLQHVRCREKTPNEPGIVAVTAEIDVITAPRM